jgi:redox-sensitive bicupin YhaK (pirin superfamily)
MITLRKAHERGHADHGWLNTYHTFSFADYQDRQHMGFRGLRVINEDRVQPGQGFGTHSHQNMEIISYVLEGALQHRDSMGTGAVIRPGEVQRMSAGAGVSHSEFNASNSELVHFLQIWLLPSRSGGRPSYEQKALDLKKLAGRLQLIASPEGSEDGVRIQADAFLYAGRFDQGVAGELRVAEGRHAWVQVVRGRVRVNGHELEAGDGAACSDTPAIQLEGIEDGEVLVFDLA